MSSRGDSTICPTCLCLFQNSDCVHFISRGPNDPWEPQWNLDPDADNILEESVNGLGGFLPTWLADPPSVSAFCSIDQVVPWDTAWPLLFNIERYDTDSMHSIAEDISRFTFNTAGVYELEFIGRWKKVDASSGDVAAFIRRNTADFIAIDSMPVGNSDLFTTHPVSIIYPFKAGEFVEILVKQDCRDDEGDKVNLPLTVERFSPNFTATLKRPYPS